MAEAEKQIPSTEVVQGGKEAGRGCAWFAVGHAPIIAVDFDGTLGMGGWPDISKCTPNRLLFKCLQRWRSEYGAKLILWTCRCGVKLADAVEFCKAHGLEFDAANENLPEMVEMFGNDCRKIFANVYLDDKAMLCGLEDTLDCVEAVDWDLQLWQENSKK